MMRKKKYKQNKKNKRNKVFKKKKKYNKNIITKTINGTNAKINKISFFSGKYEKNR